MLTHAYTQNGEYILGPVFVLFSFFPLGASLSCGAGVAFAVFPVAAVVATARGGVWEMLVY